MRLTLKAINDALAALGHTARLQREESYFYLRFGEAADWHDCTANVPTLRSMTLAQWIGELKRLNSQHQRIMAGKWRAPSAHQWKSARKPWVRPERPLTEILQGFPEGGKAADGLNGTIGVLGGL